MARPVCANCRHHRINHSGQVVCDAPQLGVKRDPEWDAKFEQIFGVPFVHGEPAKLVRGWDPWPWPGHEPELCGKEGVWFLPNVGEGK